MADNARLIRDLYEEMDRHDGDAMAGLYDPEGYFSDPAFGELSGAEAGDMWRMLTGRAEAGLVLGLRPMSLLSRSQARKDLSQFRER